MILNTPSRESLPLMASLDAQALFADEVVEALSYVGDTCALDVAERVRARGKDLSEVEAGRVMGMSDQGARRARVQAGSATIDALRQRGVVES
jgi:hypothetical protein